MNRNNQIEQLRLAAEKGNPEAQFNLAFTYFKGQGVSKNINESLKWLRRSADQGFPMALCSLARLYYTGDGVQQNIDEAVKLFRLAAERGDASAKNILEEILKRHVTPSVAPSQKNIQLQAKPKKKSYIGCWIVLIFVVCIIPIAIAMEERVNVPSMSADSNSGTSNESGTSERKKSEFTTRIDSLTKKTIDLTSKLEAAINEEQLAKNEEETIKAYTKQLEIARNIIELHRQNIIFIETGIKNRTIADNAIGDVENALQSSRKAEVVISEFIEKVEVELAELNEDGEERQGKGKGYTLLDMLPKPRADESDESSSQSTNTRHSNNTNISHDPNQTPVRSSIPVTGLSLDKTSLTMNEGDSETLISAIIPPNATNQSVSWSSSNPSVAIVNEHGRISAIAPGTATIYAISDAGKIRANCNLFSRPSVTMFKFVL